MKSTSWTISYVYCIYCTFWSYLPPTLPVSPSSSQIHPPPQPLLTFVSSFSLNDEGVWFAVVLWLLLSEMTFCLFVCLCSCQSWGLKAGLMQKAMAVLQSCCPSPAIVFQMTEKIQSSANDVLFFHVDLSSWLMSTWITLILLYQSSACDGFLSLFLSGNLYFPSFVRNSFFCLLNYFLEV